MLDEENVDAIVSSPSVEQHLFLIGIEHRDSHNQNLPEPTKSKGADEYSLDTASWEGAERERSILSLLESQRRPS